MTFKDLNFETKLELFVEYMNSFILQTALPTTQIYITFVDYNIIKDSFNKRLLNKNKTMFYRFYRECICNYNEKIKHFFTNQFTLHQYNYHMIASLAIQYMYIYDVSILDSFYKIIASVD